MNDGRSKKYSFCPFLDSLILQLSLVTWPLIGSEAGVTVLMQTSLPFVCRSCCSYANYYSVFTCEKKYVRQSII